MRVLTRFRPVVLATIIATIATAAIGAEPAATPPASGTQKAAPAFADRLFLAFAQDAALVPSQWWEGRVEYADGKDNAPNVWLVRGVFAFHPIKSLEVGGNVGFGHASSSVGPGGTGATDLDVCGKWVFADVSSNLDLTAGLLISVPTGDDTAGLGYNAFGSQIFGGLRYRMRDVVIGGQVGVRYNGNGKFQGIDHSGKTSFALGGSAIFPLANQVAIVAEAQFESDRFEDIDASTQLLVGVNWRAFGRGMLRGAVSGGLTGGAPNFRVILGYAYSF